MLINFFRSILIYIVVLVVMRMMGKREIGQLEPFEFVISIMIADLASIPMTSSGVPLSNGIIPILGLLVMDLFISFFNMKSMLFKKIICGKPSILIYKGKIDEKILKKERFTINELQEKLRGKDIFNIGDVEYAILETSGEISVITKPGKKNVTLGDLKIETDYEGLTYDLVIDGKVQFENLQKIGKDYTWLKKEIKKFGFSPEDALVVTIDGKSEIFCQKKFKKEKHI